MATASHKILLIEPDYRLRLGLKSMLKGAGHAICGETTEMKEALPLLQAHKPELVLLADAPDFSAWDCARELLHEQISSVILLSSEIEAEKAAQSGVYACLPRPAEKNVLLPAIEIACARFQEKKELMQETEELRDLLALRKMLDQAKGILMKKHHMSEQEAHRRIQRYAMYKRLTVKSVAEAIIKATGGKH